MKTIAITLRGSISASHNTWSGVLWACPEPALSPVLSEVEGEVEGQSRRDQGELYVGPTFDITHIVDRVGGGDSFMGGLIYSLRTYGEDRQKALNFAVAASCLKHSVIGDFNLATVAEVEKLMAGDVSGRVSR